VCHTYSVGQPYQFVASGEDAELTCMPVSTLRLLLQVKGGSRPDAVCLLCGCRLFLVAVEAGAGIWMRGCVGLPGPGAWVVNGAGRRLVVGTSLAGLYSGVWPDQAGRSVGGLLKWAADSSPTHR
jgi:hypothetical protein